VTRLSYHGSEQRSDTGRQCHRDCAPESDPQCGLHDIRPACPGADRTHTTLCPGGKERMRRLMDTIASGRLDTRSLVTHRFRLDQIEEAYDLFANQRDGVLKVAITP
jgi:hypothetical protein